MALQRDRIYSLVIGNLQNGEGLKISDLQITFQISKSASNKDRPDRCRIKIYNLSEVSLGKFKSEYLSAELKVGYRETGLHTLYSGDITYFRTKKEGPDRITELDIGSSYTALHQTDISEVVPSGSTVQQVLERIRAAMPDIAKGVYTGTGITQQATYGYPLSGTPKQMLDELAESYDIEWRIDSKVLYVNDAKGHTGNEVDAPIISPTTGMIESPYYTSGDRRRHKKDPAKKEGIEFICLINPTIKPGSLVVLRDTGDISGPFKVDSVEFHGDYRGDTWDCKVYCTGKIEK
jgi:hypothetical protein